MAKKKTVKKTSVKKKPSPSISNLTTVKDSNFYGVHWDGQALDAVNTIADALEENALALGENARSIGKMIDVFRGQNIHIEALLRVDQAKD